jgi:DNA polymerase-3 subunit gamma/tau
VKFKPSTGQFKVYIIDEVHMLTTEAFNALLKTLEEPPPHVRFIFATTESHKVPLTILSRCQRFQFKRIPVPEVVKTLEAIAKKEKLKCDEAALFLIAKASEGSLRDAESLLDQLASFSEGKIREEDVLTLLGLASDEMCVNVLTALREKNGAEIFGLVKKLYEDGADLAQFAGGLFDVFRHLLVFKMVPKAEGLVETGAEMAKQLQKKAADFSQAEILFAMSILQNLQYQLRRPIASPRLLVEAALLKLLHLDGLESVEELIQKGPAANTESAARPGTLSAGPRVSAPAPSYTPAPAPVKKMEKPVIAEAEEDSSEPPAPPPAAKVKEPETKQAANPAQNGLDINAVEKAWPQVIEYVKAKRMSVSLYLAESEPVEVDGITVVLGFPAEFKFHKETLEKENNKKLVEEAFQQVLGGRIRAQFVITQKDSTSQNAPRGAEPADEDAPDIVAKALEIFDGGRVIRKE